MRQAETQRLEACIKYRQAFRLEPYNDTPVIKFEPLKTIWIISSGRFEGYADKIELSDALTPFPCVKCYTEDGHNLAFMFFLNSFFQVKEGLK